MDTFSLTEVVKIINNLPDPDDLSAWWCNGPCPCRDHDECVLLDQYGIGMCVFNSKEGDAVILTAWLKNEKEK